MFFCLQLNYTIESTNRATLSGYPVFLFGAVIATAPCFFFFNKLWEVNRAKNKPPILRGRDISRYYYRAPELWFINTHNGIKDKKIPPININDYPAIKIHLDQFYDSLSKRTDKGETPYNLRNCTYMDDFSKQKIVWGEISDKPKFAFDINGEYTPEATAFLMVGSSLPFLYSFLNSNLSEYYFAQNGTTTGVGTVRWKKFKIEQIPVPKIDNEKAIEFSNIVNELLYLGELSNEFKEKVSQLNTMIYQLFCFDNKEIAYIESFCNNNKEY